jgi:chromosome segregation ATPase
MDGELMGEREELLRVKRIISQTKRELGMLNTEINTKAAKRNFLLRRILGIRNEEHRLRHEIAKLDGEIHRLGIKRQLHQKTMVEAKKLGLW